MTMFLRILLGRFFGKTAYEVITSPISKMQKALDKLIIQRDKEIIALETLQKIAEAEQKAAIETSAKLKTVLA